MSTIKEQVIINNNDVIYLDNNATTFMPKKVQLTMCNLFNMGNPSGEYKTAKKCKEIIQTFKEEFARVCNFSLEEYYVIFNSGASESNCHILTSTARAYKFSTGQIPHFIVSSVEHKSIYYCVKDLEKMGEIELSFIPAHFRTITPDELRSLIRTNTALVSIMSANNETGIINDLASLKSVCNDIPFHTDAVQYMGKLHFDVQLKKVDAFSVSCHKFHGPIGCGILVMKKSLVEGYKMCAHVCGTQNEHQRGGTENIIAIGGSLSAFRIVMNNLDSKAKYVNDMRQNIVNTLSTTFKCVFIEDFQLEMANSVNITDMPLIVWIAPRDFHNTLPNTILLSVYKPNICNKAMRNGLEHYNIIVGLGSACNNNADKDKNIVLNALNVPEILNDGILRISLSDMNKPEEIAKFLPIFTDLIKSNKILKSSTI